MNNQEKLNLILDDLSSWLEGSDSDCSMAYAYRNGYFLHAASLWLDTGAASEEVYTAIKNGVEIDQNKEIMEITNICDNAFIYICPECNHHGFYDDNEGDSINCQSCDSLAHLEEIGK